MDETVVTRRRVYHVAGFDPEPPLAVHARFSRGLGRFGAVWSVSTEVTQPVVEDDRARWRITSDGPGWHNEAEFHLFRWDDRITALHRRPLWRRIPEGALALADFVTGGALWGYFRHSWRYALFFLFPVLAFLGILALAAFIGVLVAGWSGSALLGGALGLAALLGLFLLAQRHIHLGLLFDDWIFARHVMRGRQDELDGRILAAGADLAAAARSGDCDEVVVIAHSLGAVLAVQIVDAAIRHEAEAGRPPPRLTLLTVGSSILKLGLHRAAKRLRDALARVSACESVFWADVQARSDLINFYTGDPMAAMGLPGRASPLVKPISLRRLLSPERYGAIRMNPYKVHCLFVRANDRRAAYDYFMLVCGPLRAETLIRAQEGAMGLIGADGRLCRVPACDGGAVPAPADARLDAGAKIAGTDGP